MKRVICHTLLPGLLAALFFTVALTPVQVLGCRTRGLIALLVAFRKWSSGIGDYRRRYQEAQAGRSGGNVVDRELIDYDDTGYRPPHHGIATKCGRGRT